MRRRDFLSAMAAAVAGACTAGSDATPSGTVATPGSGSTSPAPPPAVTPLEEPFVQLPAGVFALGVASGDPAADSVVLWTRLIGDLPPSVALLWELAYDEGFATLAATSIIEVAEDHAHSAHAVAAGLLPATRYWYRFRVGGQVSATGRTRTVAAAGQGLDRFRIGISCCQRRDSGYWTAHEDIAAADLDLMIWLGDFIYSESASVPLPGRAHTSADPTTLVEYRARYANYRSDPALQASSAAQPWMTTWDDHEVANDYDSSLDPRRLAAAYQAWWEHQPTRVPPPGDNFEIYQSIDVGTLARIIVTDTRQHADDLTLLGDGQQAWLAAALDHDRTWTVMGSSVLVGGLLVPTQREPLLPYTWDGYPAERTWLAGELGKRPNRICVSGDLHTGAVLEVRADPSDRTGSVVASEFMAPAISSLFPENYVELLPLLPLGNAHIDYLDPANGWLLLELTPESVTAEFRVLSDVSLPGQTLGSAARFELRSGDSKPTAL